MSETTSTQPSIWNEWGRITRFLESTRHAIDRERTHWANEVKSGRDPSELITRVAGKGSYTLSIQDHLNTVCDANALNISVLIQTYALVEAAACDKLNREEIGTGGIEAWGTQLLALNGRGWNEILDGLPGIIEAVIIRNIYAHGGTRYSDRDCNRLRDAGAQSRFPGEVASLTYDELRRYRQRFQSFLRYSGVQNF